MARTEIEITLRDVPEGDTPPRFEPGEVIQGYIQVTPEEDLDCRHLYARLRWQTEGRGDQDEGVAVEQDLFQGKLPAGVPRTFSFHLAAPNEPWSYAGRYVSIVWAVEAAVDLPWARDPTERVPFILAPAWR